MHGSGNQPHPTNIMQLVEELADDIVYMLEGHIHFHGNVQALHKEYGGTKVEESIATMIKKQKKG